MSVSAADMRLPVWALRALRKKFAGVLANNHVDLDTGLRFREVQGYALRMIKTQGRIFGGVPSVPGGGRR